MTCCCLLCWGYCCWRHPDGQCLQLLLLLLLPVLLPLPHHRQQERQTNRTWKHQHWLLLAQEHQEQHLPQKTRQWGLQFHRQPQQLQLQQEEEEQGENLLLLQGLRGAASGGLLP
jgi:hypothetical protein